MNVYDSSKNLFQNGCSILFSVSALAPHLINNIVTLEAFTDQEEVVLVLIDL